MCLYSRKFKWIAAFDGENRSTITHRQLLVSKSFDLFLKSALIWFVWRMHNLYKLISLILWKILVVHWFSNHLFATIDSIWLTERRFYLWMCWPRCLRCECSQYEPPSFPCSGSSSANYWKQSLLKFECKKDWKILRTFFRNSAQFMVIFYNFFLWRSTLPNESPYGIRISFF